MKFHLFIQHLQEIFTSHPSFRLQQVLTAFFSPDFKNWDHIPTLPKTLRSQLMENLPCSTIFKNKIWSSKDQETHKALLTLFDGTEIETVLMLNKKNQWTLCVSSQSGCSIGCSFCSTGQMGLNRNLDALEIAEQWCFWNRFLKTQAFSKTRISNIVLMGMGEPFLNYQSVKTALSLWQNHTDLGMNCVTLSTVGILKAMEKMLQDPEFPKVQISISLHSVNPEIRKKLIPCHDLNFFNHLKNWCHHYEKTLGSRNRPITFEYVLLKDINDSDKDATLLIHYLKGFNRIKVNLIPYNPGIPLLFFPSPPTQIALFQRKLNQSGIVATLRYSKGQDIHAACGQLISSVRSQNAEK